MPQQKVGYFTKLDPELREAMRRYKEIVGVPEAQQIDRALREWLGARPEAALKGEGMPASLPSFPTVWNRIVANAGQPFTTKRGLPFTYSLEGDGLVPSRTDYQISRSDVEKAFKLVPIDGPGAINDMVRGPAYVWAILHDSRISANAW
jgi:hypothetical protein